MIDVARGSELPVLSLGHPPRPEIVECPPHQRRLLAHHFSHDKQCQDSSLDGPGLLADTRIYDEKVDVHSYAVILWEVLTRRLPYGTLESAQIITQGAMHNIWSVMPRATTKSIQDLICNG
jgi:hypothetical protein